MKPHDIYINLNDGEIRIEIETKAVSLQGSSNLKTELKENIQELISKNFDYYITNDFSVDISWHVHEKERIETGNYADVDNIIKPIIDSLCGPQGIIIDDNQMISVKASILDFYDEMLEIVINFNPAFIIEKNDLRFIRIYDNIYIPFNKNHDKSEITQHYNNECMLISNSGYYRVKRSNRDRPQNQRVFHKSRLSGFKDLLLEN